MERDLRRFLNEDVLEISTHTLTWSVTKNIVLICALALISTHTLTWSVTIEMKLKQVKLAISTHTLTWSVTRNN